MPAPEPGHGGTRLKASPTPHLAQQDLPAPQQSRRKSTPPVSRPAESSQSTRSCNAGKPPCCRQIPIDRTGRTAAPNPPAVSSPEASPTPAARANGNSLQQRVSENPSQKETLGVVNHFPPCPH